MLLRLLTFAPSPLPVHARVRRGSVCRLAAALDASVPPRPLCASHKRKHGRKGKKRTEEGNERDGRFVDDEDVREVRQAGEPGPRRLRVAQRAAQLVRVRGQRPDLKVIFISGYAEDAFRKSLDEDGGIHFLPKPFTLKQLAAKVKEVMDA